MTVTIKIYHKNINHILDMVNDLRKKDLRQGIDFDFTVYKAELTESGTMTRRYTVFTFYTEKHATWFALTYG